VEGVAVAAELAAATLDTYIAIISYIRRHTAYYCAIEGYTLAPLWLVGYWHYWIIINKKAIIADYYIRIIRLLKRYAITAAS